MNLGQFQVNSASSRHWNSKEDKKTKSINKGILQSYAMDLTLQVWTIVSLNPLSEEWKDIWPNFSVIYERKLENVQFHDSPRKFPWFHITLQLKKRFTNVLN